MATADEETPILVAHNKSNGKSQEWGSSGLAANAWRVTKVVGIAALGLAAVAVARTTSNNGVLFTRLSDGEQGLWGSSPKNGWTF